MIGGQGIVFGRSSDFVAMKTAGPLNDPATCHAIFSQGYQLIMQTDALAWP
jgi:hypothetical protein